MYQAYGSNRKCMDGVSTSDNLGYSSYSTHVLGEHTHTFNELQITFFKVINPHKYNFPYNFLFLQPFHSSSFF